MSSNRLDMAVALAFLAPGALAWALTWLWVIGLRQEAFPGIAPEFVPAQVARALAGPRRAVLTLRDEDLARLHADVILP